MAPPVSRQLSMLPAQGSPSTAAQQMTPFAAGTEIASGEGTKQQWGAYMLLTVSPPSQSRSFSALKATITCLALEASLLPHQREKAVETLPFPATTMQSKEGDFSKHCVTAAIAGAVSGAYRTEKRRCWKEKHQKSYTKRK